MLMIGGAGRNAGKTTFACEVIGNSATLCEITALKVTTVSQRDGCERICRQDCRF